ncbi:RES family NAD+ phosphorylase [Acetobacter orleanensis]|uniref:RES domain-containing protein n=1 Tax=Acetobacter orleanensis TaxID=104099 RepID=A0A4Y3TRS5_9PROT|nr:RES family NAD+ phosphorylase [Acetobacter orleanensis]KXV66009.1 hypothetical protein AD949_03475 [Acetobacter orleanensis]PCD78505.1 RES domain-containing protein [Acetobacter orleanensis]GAN69570.1 hypothetical protein Abol_047_005 [Acetobacter orleanensis JCM 7639]GBR28803.1 hypothetical protein AA0473_1854 [Acetobacter orleanensis NRIC 0473]GEB83710.1 hypothetical protein AOR01nite_21870 [Acetobacter orleanensis]
MSESYAELRLNYICYGCIKEHYLKNEVFTKGEDKLCYYCNSKRKAFLISDIACRINVVFNDYFRQTNESKSGLECDGIPIIKAIANTAGLTDAAAQDMQTILAADHLRFWTPAMGGEAPYSSNSYYREQGPNDQMWQDKWKEFELNLKEESRFFSSFAAEYLADVFKEIGTMSDADENPLIVDAGPGTKFPVFYRARAFQSDESLKIGLRDPEKELGPPPARLSIAGRMNAQGISVFYGASEPRTAIAEVRPPVGSQVVVARFKIAVPLRLLNLAALGCIKEEGSVFDPEFGNRLDHAMFLRSLKDHMTKPVMPSDQVLDYLPTQAIADFLANLKKPVIDGILFPSVQDAGDVQNVVLFYKAALVETLEQSEQMEAYERSGQSWEEFCFRRTGEEMRGQLLETSPPDDDAADWLLDVGPWSPSDLRAPTLRLDRDSIEVYRVRGVDIHTDDNVSTRFRDIVADHV